MGVTASVKSVGGEGEQSTTRALADHKYEPRPTHSSLPDDEQGTDTGYTIYTSRMSRFGQLARLAKIREQRDRVVELQSVLY